LSVPKANQPKGQGPRQGFEHCTWSEARSAQRFCQTHAGESPGHEQPTTHFGFWHLLPRVDPMLGRARHTVLPGSIGFVGSGEA
jgi:hypothetical protein